jgi:phospholipid/cholesterol/gamma-HCH transport system substrate-binding protein
MKELRRFARMYWWVVSTIGVFIVIAAAVAAYILDHQRLRWPWENVTKVYVELPSAQAVSPGQGQQVLISGVQVGEVGDVKLDRGRALVRLDLEPDRAGSIYRNATFLLRPKTALNDMSVQIDPGTPNRALANEGELQDGDRVGVANSQVNVNSDEVFAALDADTRRYFNVLISVGGRGTRGRGEQIRDVLKAGQPTFARLNRVTGALADRRRQLRRLVTNLRLLARATARKDDELADLVQGSAATFGALGEREAELEESVARLPGALGATRRALADTRTLAAEAGPALDALRPAARELGPSLRAAKPLFEEATPTLRRQVNPLVTELIPLLRELRPPLRALQQTTGGLETTGKVLNRLVNQLGFNPPGKEEGYLFWLAWFAHNANSIFSIEDAQGVAWRGLIMGSCSSLQGVLSLALPPATVSALIGGIPACP